MSTKTYKPAKGTVPTKTANPLGVEATNGRLSVEERTKMLLLQRSPVSGVRTVYFNDYEPESPGVRASIVAGGDWAGRALVKIVEVDFNKVARCDPLECAKLLAPWVDGANPDDPPHRAIIGYIGLPKPKKSSQKEQDDMGKTEDEVITETCEQHTAQEAARKERSKSAKENDVSHKTYSVTGSVD